MNNSQLITVLDRSSFIFDKTRPITQWLNVIGTGTFFLIVCVTFVDVFLRYLFSRPITGGLETMELLMVLVVSFGLAYAQFQDAHIRIDLVVNRLSPKGQVVINSTMNFISVGMVGLITWRTAAVALRYLETDSGTQVLHVPLSPFAYIIALGFMLFLLALLRDSLNSLVKGLRLGLRSHQWLLVFGIPVLLVSVMILWLQLATGEVNPLIAGGVGIGLSLVFMFCGMPVGLAMLLAALLGMADARGLWPALDTMGMVPMSVLANFNYAVLAFFVMMGCFISFAAFGKDLYYSAYRWFGQFRGGLALATIGASTAFAAIVGDAVAEVVTMGKVALPEMRRYKYHDSLATGSIIAGSTLGPIIPPSVPLILCGIFTYQSIGDLFIAGIFPGLLIAVSFMTVIYLHCRHNPELGPPGEKSNWAERLGSLKAGGPVFFLFILVIGGIYAGVFTPTEGGAIGAFGAFLIALVMRRINWQSFAGSLIDAGKLVSVVFLILIGGVTFGYFIAACGFSAALVDATTRIVMPPIAILLFILLIFFVLGFVVSGAVLTIVFIPIFYPVAVAMGYNPIFFSLAVVIVIGVGAITPPVGISLFAIKGVDKELSIGTIYRGALPFVLATLVVVAIVVAFPDIITWLPSALK